MLRHTQTKRHPEEFELESPAVITASNGVEMRLCACGYPIARTGWAVIGHPELTAEATQDFDGNLVIRVI